jgi:hypothetical protein
MKDRTVESVAVHIPAVKSNVGRRVTTIANNSARIASANSFESTAVRFREKNRSPTATKTVAAAIAGKRLATIDTKSTRMISANSCASAAVRLSEKNKNATVTDTAISAMMELIP